MSIRFQLLILITVTFLSGCTGSKEVQHSSTATEEKSSAIEAANEIEIVDAPGTDLFEVEPESLINRSKNTEDSIYYKNEQTNKIVEKIFFPKEEERPVSNVVFSEKTKILQVVRIGQDRYIVCMQDKFTNGEVPAGVVEDSDFTLAVLENGNLKPLLRRYDLQRPGANVDFRYDISSDYVVIAPYENKLVIYSIPSEKIVKTISVSDSHIRNPSVYQNIVAYTVAKDSDNQHETTSVYYYDILKDDNPKLLDVNSSFPFVFRDMIFYSQQAELTKSGERKYSIVMRHLTGEKKVLATGLINPIWDADFQGKFVNFHINSSGLHNSVFDYSGNPLGSLEGLSIGSNIVLMYDRTYKVNEKDRMLRFIAKRIVLSQ